MAIYEPKITAATITPNPASINTSIKISVSVTEVQVTMYKVYAIAGALRAGQAVNLNTRKEVST